MPSPLLSLNEAGNTRTWSVTGAPQSRQLPSHLGISASTAISELSRASRAFKRTWYTAAAFHQCRIGVSAPLLFAMIHTETRTDAQRRYRVLLNKRRRAGGGGVNSAKPCAVLPASKGLPAVLLDSCTDADFCYRRMLRAANAGKLPHLALCSGCMYVGEPRGPVGFCSQRRLK